MVIRPRPCMRMRTIPPPSARQSEVVSVLANRKYSTPRVARVGKQTRKVAVHHSVPKYNIRFEYKFMYKLDLYFGTGQHSFQKC